MGWLRNVVAGMVLLVSTTIFAGEFTRLTPEDFDGTPRYEYSGKVQMYDYILLQGIVNANDKIELVINSPGGSLYGGIFMGEVIGANQEKVDVFIGKAYSAAAIMAVADDNEQYLDDESLLGWHLPFMRGDDPSNIDQKRIAYPAQWMTVGKDLHRYLGKYIEDGVLETLWLDMSNLQILHGTQALVVWKSNDRIEFVIPDQEPEEEEEDSDSADGTIVTQDDGSTDIIWIYEKGLTS